LGILLARSDPCRYDKWARPSKNGEPTQVYARIYVYFLGSIEAQHLVRVSKLDDLTPYTKSSLRGLGVGAKKPKG
jgi:hypothetical protein